MIHRDIGRLCLVWFCGICGALCLPLGALAKDLLPDRQGTQWAPYLEWSLENATYEGNPVDLLATATFVHEGSGETRTTGMFHDGGATWKFRFTGTRTGRWTFVTSSADPDLSERRGVVTILPHPSGDVPGFVAAKRPDKPSFSEDRFRIRKSKSYASKDYDMEMTRRGLWHSTMAGGVANIWGRLDSGAGESGSAPYPRPEWIKTWSTFFKTRFVKDMIRAEELTDGVCLKRPSDRHFVFYKESTTSIQMDLSNMSGSQPAVAIDARKPYAEIDLGDTAPSGRRKWTWTAPYRSDWAIAVGDFALDITGASR